MPVQRPSTLQLFFIVACFVLKIHAQSDEELIADAGLLGEIRGEYAVTFLNLKPFVRFTGIPYAKPPVAETRFLPPEAINTRLAPVGETFNASSERYGIKCVQTSFVVDAITAGTKAQMRRTGFHEKSGSSSNSDGALAYDGEEDCLVLNVYTPKLAGNYPVIVFIHGGSFHSGFSSFYEPDRLLEQDVVVVTVNYRLGVLGFFCLETNETPGNAAMYDLVTALHWVQNYIAHFGGNRNLVTVTGQSSGAAAVSYLMLSEMTQSPTPLFHRAIALSGSALNTWAVNEHPKAASLRIAKLVGCPVPDDEDEIDDDAVISCMRLADANDLVTALATYQNQERREGRLGVDAISPVIQHSAFEPKFIGVHPLEVLEQGKQLNVPLMMGATKHDGSYPLGIVYNRYLNCVACLDRLNDADFLQTELIPTILRAMGLHADTDEVYDALAEQYLKEAKSSGNFSHMVYGLIDLNSVYFFKGDIYKNMELHSKLNPSSYFYSFEHMGEYSVFNLLFPAGLKPKVPGGIAHGDDLIYLLMNIDLNPEDQRISSKMVQQWSRFAISGNPNPSFGIFIPWPAFNALNPQYLRLTNATTNIIENDYPSTWEDASLDLKPEEPPAITTTEGPAETTTEGPVQPPPDYIVDAGALGDIRGEPGMTFLTNKPYVRYTGIPYAKPPLAETRFLPPEAINTRLTPVGQTFNASSERYGIKCVQQSFNPAMAHAHKRTEVHENSQSSGLGLDGARASEGDEDCLVLNVYTPKLPADGGVDFPVIVFIHGGSFLSGFGSFYEPDRLLEEDVVVVTVNYRLGVLGFFCLETNETPGNAAMYDLVTALHWVQNYIAHFGGNPDSVTIAGQSAGAAAVSYLMLTEMSRSPTQLFHRAIALSGSALNTWAVNEHPKAASLRIAQLVGCPVPEDEDELDINAVISCMRLADANDLVTALATYQNQERREGRLGVDAISPVIQHSTFEPKFIGVHPLEILEQGSQLNVPLLMGATQHDGSYPLGIVYNRYLNCVACLDRLSDPAFLKTELIPTILRAMGLHADTDEVYEQLAEQYLKEAKSSGNFSHMVYGLIDLNSVYFFKGDIYKNMQLHSKLNPSSYFYSFEHMGEYSVFHLLFPEFTPNVPGGVAHGDDLIYLLTNIDLNLEDQGISSRMISHWANFATSGNPNPTIGFDIPWLAFTETATGYLRLHGSTNVIENDYPGTWEDASLVLKPEEPTTPPPQSTTPGATNPTNTPTDAPTVPTEAPTGPTGAPTGPTVTLPTTTTPTPTAEPGTESTTAESSAPRFSGQAIIMELGLFTFLWKFLY